MSERYEEEAIEPTKEREIANRLESLLREKTGADFKLTEYDGTYEIDDDNFELTFTIEADLLEIRSIEARGRQGMGRTIVGAIHSIADEEGLDVIASNVLDTAIGFWKEMGYEEGSEDGEYFRV